MIDDTFYDIPGEWPGWILMARQRSRQGTGWPIGDAARKCPKKYDWFSVWWWFWWWFWWFIFIELIADWCFLGGGFKYFLFSPLFGEDSHFDSYFSNGLKPPTSFSLIHFASPLHRRGRCSYFQTTRRRSGRLPRTSPVPFWPLGFLLLLEYNAGHAQASPKDGKQRYTTIIKKLNFSRN